MGNLMSFPSSIPLICKQEKYRWLSKVFVFMSNVKQLNHIFTDSLELFLSLYSIFLRMVEDSTVSCIEQVPALLLEVWSSNLCCKINGVFCIWILSVKQKSWVLTRNDKQNLGLLLCKPKKEHNSFNDLVVGQLKSQY